MGTETPISEATEASRSVRDFAFLTNHGKTLLLIAHDPRIRIRDIAASLDITERATQSIVADLANAGYINRSRIGRRNLYTVSTHLPLGLPTQRDADIGSLLTILPPPTDSHEREAVSR
jgi:Winged helix-turn-helix DNA-binding